MTDEDDEDTVVEAPLARAMTVAALSLVDRIVVNAPVIGVFCAQKREEEDGEVYEVIARTGLLLRGPFALVGWPRRARRRGEPVVLPILVA